MLKRLINSIVALLAGVMILSMTPVFCYAEDNVIADGIYAGDIYLSGMTAEEATAAINAYVNNLRSKMIDLYTVNDNEVSVTPADFGLTWTNKEIIDEAISLGKKGNVVSRYKAKKDIANNNQIFDIKLEIDKSKVEQILVEQCAIYDQVAKNGTVTMVEGEFNIHEGVAGMKLDVEASLAGIEDFILNRWSGQNSTYQLAIVVDVPSGTPEDLALVKDVLGTYHTNFKTSTQARCANVMNGASHINGTIIYPGETFSFTACVSPFTLDNGYKLAPSYASGRVVDSIGGGICQVSSTLYNAVLLAELDVTQRRNHGMIVTYVKPAMDATIAESSGTDFQFVNNTDAPIYIEAYTTDEKDLYITIYGHDTRPEGRELSYESEVISKTDPGPDVIIQDSSQPIGYFSSQAAHVGYKANCWKVVTFNGETTRELVNTSVYNAAPKYITVGTGTSDPAAAALMSQAIATGDISVIKSTAATIKSAAESGQQLELDAEAALAAYEAALAAQKAAEQSNEEPQ